MSLRRGRVASSQSSLSVRGASEEVFMSCAVELNDGGVACGGGEDVCAGGGGRLGAEQHLEGKYLLFLSCESAE